MKKLLVAMMTLLVSFNLPANEEERLQVLLKRSQSSHSLATSKLGSFRDPRLNALTNRIQDDQRVIQEAIKDTARLREYELPKSTKPETPEAVSTEEFLRRQIELQEEILSIVKASDAPVVENMKGRVQSSLKNAKSIQREKQAEEESL